MRRPTFGSPVLFCAAVTSRPPELEILKRGSVDLIEEAELARRLEGGRLTVKVGFDPSAPDIHLGHTVVIRKMKHFQDAGHRVVFVVGDFTGMIGDPSGRKSTRPQLTRAEIEANAATYARQAFRILDPEKTAIEFNSSWLSPLGAEGFVRLAGKITVARIAVSSPVTGARRSVPPRAWRRSCPQVDSRLRGRSPRRARTR